jgi:hypothetical protein
MMEATGQVAAARTVAVRRYEGSDPKLRAIFQTDKKRCVLREETIDDAVIAALGANVPVFVQLFGGLSGQAQDGGDPTVHQALFLNNGAVAQNWLAPSSESLTDRLAHLSGPAIVAEELYLSVLSRRPTAEERNEVCHYLAERDHDRVVALQDLAWALLTSTEFRFNH